MPISKTNLAFNRAIEKSKLHRFTLDNGESRTVRELPVKETIECFDVGAAQMLARAALAHVAKQKEQFPEDEPDTEAAILCIENFKAMVQLVAIAWEDQTRAPSPAYQPMRENSPRLGTWFDYEEQDEAWVWDTMGEALADDPDTFEVAVKWGFGRDAMEARRKLDVDENGRLSGYAFDKAPRYVEDRWGAQQMGRTGEKLWALVESKQPGRLGEWKEVEQTAVLAEVDAWLTYEDSMWEAQPDAGPDELEEMQRSKWRYMLLWCDSRLAELRGEITEYEAAFERRMAEERAKERERVRLILERAAGAKAVEA